MKVRVELIDQAYELEDAFSIRERVFVEEQEVAAEEEYDECWVKASPILHLSKQHET